MSDKYELSNIQLAYLLGRNENIYLGGNSTHFYAEIITRLEPSKFEVAFNKVIKYQPMLRTIILSEGTQQTLNEVPEYQINVSDISELNSDEKDRIIENKRKTTSHRIFKTDEWPLFSIEMYKENEEEYRLVVDFDMLIIDGLSIDILINDIIMFYEDETLETVEIENTFEKYIAEHKEYVEKSKENDLAFWDEQVKSMPMGPALPVKVEEGRIYKFAQKEHVILAKDWDEIKKKLRIKRVIPAMYIFGAYSKMLSKFCNQKELTVNLTTTNRRGDFRKYANVIGDFTEVLPIDLYFDKNTSVIEAAQDAQKRLMLYRKHSSIGGTTIIKKFAEYNRISNGVPFPVVFTSMLTDTAQSGWDKLGERVYQMSQTPQVILDNNVTERQGNLIIRWDYLKDCFDDDMADMMFDYYVNQLLNACDDKKVNTELSCWNEYNNTLDADIPDATLQSLFRKSVLEYKDKTAFICGNERISYKELDELSNKMACTLVEKYGKGKAFLIEAYRSINTVAWMLAVLKTGGFYIPVEVTWPESRKKYIMDSSKAETIINPLSDNIVEESISFDGIYNNVDDLAYIIYTSGSTGAPKGVAISNKAVSNTVIDINKRFDINENDIFIGISSFCFDLSVYDIYGAIEAGATCVLMQDRVDISEYRKIFNRYEVSVWNSVPAIFEMVLNNTDIKSTSIRKVLLSGDWIPLDLPQKAKNAFEVADIYSLGGATEASIWSIYYPIKQVNELWSSIPYGYPLANQTIYIIDYENELCPIGVEGEICIGGKGVANGYFNDEVRTSEQFIEHPSLGKIYRTGDYGILSKDGYIIFRGRRDEQVKVHGYRIELGEIESKIKGFKGVMDAIAIVDNTDGNSNLVGYVVAENNKKIEITENIEAATKAAEKAAKNFPKEITIHEYRSNMDRLDMAAIGVMAESIQKLGALFEDYRLMSIEEMLEKGIISISYKKVMTQWFNALDKNGYIRNENDALYLSKDAFMDVDGIFDEVMGQEVLRHWREFFDFVRQCRENIVDILRGNTNPVSILFPNGDWSRAENYYKNNPVAEYYNRLVAKSIRAFVKSNPACTRILEVGAGTGGTSTDIFQEIKDLDVEYTYTDLTTFFTDKAKEMFAQYDFIKYGIYSIDDDPQAQGFEIGTYDIIVGANVLHDATIVSNTLVHLEKLLKKNGIFVILETTEQRLIQKVSVGLIEGFSNYSDDREDRSQPLLTVSDWQKAFAESGCSIFKEFPSTEESDYDQHVLIATPDIKREYVSVEALKKYLKEELPGYMLPDYIFKIDEIPLSGNGKVRRNLLPKYNLSKKENNRTNIELPTTDTEKALYDIITCVLHNIELDVNDNLFEIGIDSLKAISIVTECNNRGFDISLVELYSYPSIRAVANFIDESNLNGADKKIDYKSYAVKPHYSGEKYELNEIQAAYLYGRNEAFELGNISTHYYAEFDVNLDILKFEESLNQVIEHQPMLRTVVYNDGMQQILDKVERYSIRIKKCDVLTVREELSHKMHKTGIWPMFDIVAVEKGNNNYTLCFSLDVMLADGASIYLLWNEIAAYYNGKTRQPIRFDFADYLESLKALESTEIYAEDEAYWIEKVDKFPLCVQLPYIKSFANVKKPHFKRCSAVVDKERWSNFLNIAKSRKFTPAALLCSAYASVLSKYGNSKNFAINMTVFNRYPFYEQVNEMIGDFTSTCILDIHSDSNLWTQTENIQKTIFEGMEHRSYDGIKFVRQLSKNNKNPLAAVVPVVFTCALFDIDMSELNELGKVSYIISQTSQTALDNQTTVMNGELHIAWDYVEQLFDESLIKEMFEAYVGLINSIIDGVDLPVIENKNLNNLIENYNATKEEYAPTTLDGLFKKQLQKTPDKTAVIYENKKYSYKELDAMSSQIADYLVKNDNLNMGVAIYGQKTPEIVAAILGVLKAGCYYVPVSPDFPEERINYIMQSSNCKTILRTEFIRDKIFANYDPNFSGIAHSPEDIAYIIYTSGSTGKPKGVVITHEACGNTILDINRKFNIGNNDKIIGLSSFSFDLSVYDLFGSISTGATLVLVKEYRNINEIKKILNAYNITFWNSVPAIMQMVVDALGENETYESIRNVLLSGDWIPLNLPEKIEQSFPNAKVCSLGGATEASIWSIYYPIEKVESEWKSIPYGYPLANQTIYILNDFYELCPVGVRGEIYIGGIGLAQKYMANEKENELHFIDNTPFGRLYRTGDYGIFHADGYVEFVGRVDEQIKLHGYRIELEEISDVLKQHDKIMDAISIVTKGDSQQIISYVIPKEETLKNEIDKNWSASIQIAKDLAENTPKEISVERYKSFNDVLCQDSLKLMVDSIRTIYESSFNEKLENAKISVNEFVNKGNIKNLYYKVIKRWFMEFEKVGYARHIQDDVYVMADGKTLYSSLHSIDDFGLTENEKDYFDDSLNFFRLCKENSVRLLKGEETILNLLFPNGKWDVAENLYKTNPMAEYYNSIVAESIAAFISEKKDVRILETGAGIGGTTAKVLERLKNNEVSYVYTDLSTFFTDTAKLVYKDYEDKLVYDLFDINLSPQEQGYDLEQYDVIMAANMLHDAKYLDTTLGYFRNMLKPGGMLIFLEQNENNRLQMVTTSMIDGFSDYNDFRLEQNAPLLSSSKWIECLTRNQFVNAKSFPASGNINELYGQSVIMARKPMEKEFLSKTEVTELVDYAGRYLTRYMVPGRIIQLKEFPLNENSKVSKKLLPLPKFQAESGGKHLAPQTEVEKFLFEKWAEVLGTTEFGVDDDFYEAGGDSLKAISLISNINTNKEIDVRKFMDGASIREMAEYFEKENIKVVIVSNDL